MSDESVAPISPKVLANLRYSNAFILTRNTITKMTIMNR
jgi:hypothetical protein